MKTGEVKTVGRRKGTARGLAAAAGFLRMVVRLRQGRPFLPRGVHRFASFEESNEWSLRMTARRSSPARRPSKTS